MFVVTFNFKSGSKVEIPLKKSLSPLDFRHFLSALKRDTCITDPTLVDGYYFIDCDAIDSVAYSEKKSKTKTLKEVKE